jgi:lipopolysaccharide export LptBFGC system permease protein LptF
MVVILVYTNALMLTRNWVETGWMNPWVGLLWPHVVALTLAAVLLAKQTLWFKRLRQPV